MLVLAVYSIPKRIFALRAKSSTNKAAIPGRTFGTVTGYDLLLPDNMKKFEKILNILLYIELCLVPIAVVAFLLRWHEKFYP